jgi:arginyl-tRNA--protein-N-Asp/Glu arginylyltransferase
MSSTVSLDKSHLDNLHGITPQELALLSHRAASSRNYRLAERLEREALIEAQVIDESVANQQLDLSLVYKLLERHDRKFSLQEYSILDAIKRAMHDERQLAYEDAGISLEDARKVGFLAK